MEERARRRDVFAFVFIAVFIAVVVFPWREGLTQAGGPPLPRPLGPISDYGAQLGPQTRRALQQLAEALQTQADVAVRLLITLLDPFSDPARLADALWEAWGLDARTILLLFVREAGEWTFVVRAGAELAPALLEPELQGLFERVRQLTQQRRVARAARLVVEGLAERFLPPPPPAPAAPTPKPEGAPGEWAWVVGGLALAGLALGLSVVRRRRCPRCGEPLRRRARALGMASFRHGHGRARSPRDGWVYSCRRCGYTRIASRGERGGGPQGRPSPQRRRVERRGGRP